MALLDDGERKDRIILSGIHEYYKPDELVGKTCTAIVNLPPRKMMGIGSVSEKQRFASNLHHLMQKTVQSEKNT